MSQAFAFTAAAAVHASAEPTTNGRVLFRADDRQLLLLGLQKVVLTILTLGVYHFWGRAEMRRRLHSAISLDGRAFGWSGTGERSCRNFFIAMIVASPGIWMMLWQAGVTTSGAPELRMPEGFTLRRVLIGVPLVFLLGSAVYRRRSHFLRNTWIDGHNFALVGGAWAYGWRHFWTSLVVAPTLGWIVPWRTEMLAARMVREQAFADQRFSYDANWRALLRPFVWVWGAAAVVYIGMMLTLAVAIGPQMVQFANTRSLSALSDPAVASRAFTIIAGAVILFYLIAKAWHARCLMHQAARTTIGSTRFALRMPIAGYVMLTGTNIVLRIVSLGVLSPWCEARHWRFLFDHLEVYGPLPQTPQS